DDARQQTARAREQSARLNALATDLLDLTRLDADPELRREPIELGELARAVAAEFELRAEERDVRIAAEDSRGGIWGSGDPGSVARVIRILVDNALRFAPPRSTVHVAAERFGELVGIAVSDDGPGVPRDESEVIFERFHRGSNTGGAGGFGLGLAIGRELAVRMGGDLALEESARGARFVLRLPPAAADELPLEPPKARETAT
ncbi:MAG: sensor histidine kinase, partial [Thermoleophilaceae bacterium]